MEQGDKTRTGGKMTKRKLKTLTLLMSDAAVQRGKDMARQQGLRWSAYARRAIERFLKEDAKYQSGTAGKEK